ncbi:MAG: acetyl-CoA carboxylase carboxyltransferase subunit beta [Bdellovibrionales bacterium]|nr:acetyl-CoA carboxylase carboxyltransferase subunit beta [Bdellovibrionales bacterium]
MSWFDKLKAPKFKKTQKSNFPEGLWTKCESCSEIIFHEDLLKHFMVCPQCGFHMKISARRRIELVCDPGQFQELDIQMQSKDPLEFKDVKKYKDRVKSLQKKGGEKEAFIYGLGKCKDLDLVIGSFVFEYMGGSMGSVVGEKMTRSFELALEKKVPVLLITSSGGARMQEGIVSLMQMAKSVAALKKMKSSGLPLIVLLTDPTTGGVAASVAMLGDVILAEPNALIGFAGPRVIEQTIKQTLPEGFQRSEFLLEHGIVDRIVTRMELKDTVHYLLKSFVKGPSKAIQEKQNSR